MQKKQKTLKKRVFFNASVILAGLKSPTGGSAKLLSLCKKRVIGGVISEIVFDEVIRNSLKIGLKREEVGKEIKKLLIFFKILSSTKAMPMY